MKLGAFIVSTVMACFLWACGESSDKGERRAVLLDPPKKIEPGEQPGNAPNGPTKVSSPGLPQGYNPQSGTGCKPYGQSQQNQYPRENSGHVRGRPPQQYNPNGQQQYNPNGQQQYNPNGQQQYNPNRQQQYNPNGQQQYNPNGQQQYNQNCQPGPGTAYNQQTQADGAKY
jgi:hypothetical protein